MPRRSCPRRPRPAATTVQILGATAALLLIGAFPGARVMGAGTPDKATSSWAARRESIRAIPLQKLHGPDLENVRFVLKHTTIYRRMPVKRIDCDPQLFLFLVRHPEVVVSIWEVLGVSDVSLRRTGDGTFAAADGQGTVGAMKILHDTPNRQLVYAEGSYEGPLLKWPIRGQCVLLLRTGYRHRPNGRYEITAQLDSFTYIDRAAMKLLAKTFQPLVTLAADYNFTETMAFVGDLSRATQRNPRGVARLCGKLTDIDPATRRQLLELTRRVAARSPQRRAEYHHRPLTLAQGNDLVSSSTPLAGTRPPDASVP